MASWQVQKAKTRFSELLEDANTKGPQIITRHGADRAVVLSPEEYRKLAAKEAEKTPNFIEFLLKGPPLDEGDEFFDIMENIRDKSDTGREIDL